MEGNSPVLILSRAHPPVWSWGDGPAAIGRSTSPYAHKFSCDALGNKARGQRETERDLTLSPFFLGLDVVWPREVCWGTHSVT